MEKLESGFKKALGGLPKSVKGNSSPSPISKLTGSKKLDGKEILGGLERGGDLMQSLGTGIKKGTQSLQSAINTRSMLYKGQWDSVQY